MVKEIAKLSRRKQKLALDIVNVLTYANIEMDVLEIISKINPKTLKTLCDFISSKTSKEIEELIINLNHLSKLIDVVNAHSQDLIDIKAKISEAPYKEDSAEKMIKSLSKGVETLNVR